MSPLGMFPEFDEDGNLVSITEYTSNGPVVIPVKEMNEHEEVLRNFFRDKPNGTTITYTNDPGDVLEITKLSDDSFDAIHHFARGKQEAVRKIPLKLLPAEVFMYHYDVDTMTETDTFIFDDTDKSEITAAIHVSDDDDGNNVTHIHLEMETPDGDVKTHDRYQIVQNMKDADNIEEFHPLDKDKQ